MVKLKKIASQSNCGHTCQRKRFSLKNILEGWSVDDEHLADEGEEDGQAERPVGEETQLEHRLGQRARREGVEHVKEDKAGERHGRVPVGYLPVLHHLLEHVESAADNDRR